jgi:hypothetical protein
MSDFNKVRAEGQPMVKEMTAETFQKDVPHRLLCGAARKDF